MTVVCPPCQLQMNMKKSGVTVELRATFGGYQLYQSDLYACPNCDTEVLAGFGSQPVAEHFEPGYAQQALNAKCRYWSSVKEKEQSGE